MRYSKYSGRRNGNLLFTLRTSPTPPDEAAQTMGSVLGQVI